ncbi:hypothetical protein BN1723_012605 [Verticillium longisporum]|uniref:NADH-cytochrome b5 reductase 2 n=2 Tax=Verticillium longisporum TaxID=100787 RepID=A0A0G4LJJ6_VERLO|nr:hypothetical protein BN1723_012605 [Verticillium longisporum]
MSQTPSPATSPPAASPASNPNHPPLPPLVTSPPNRHSTLPRPLSHASKNRLSQYSTGSIPSRSRPPSHIFPMFPSSLPYTLVRDFAYPVVQSMHYGPLPEPSHPASGLSTPMSESRRLSDPPATWDSKMSWETGGWQPDGFGRGNDLPPIQFGDGPPWSEDEDLQSPVVSSRHRKHKSSHAALGHGRHHGGASMANPANYDRERGYFMGTAGDGSERYYVNQGGEANGPGGDDEDAKGYLDLLVKKYPDGPMSTHMHDMTPGQRLDFKGPLPKYAWTANKHEHIALVAGGTGITPMYQLARAIFNNPADKTKVTLVFGNVTEEDILLRKEFAELENTYPQRFRAFYVLDKPTGEWSGGKGFIDKNLLKTVLPEPSSGNVKVFVCGPPGLMNAVSGNKKSPKDQGELVGILKELGYSPDQVYKF